MNYLNHFFSIDLALHMKGNQQQAPETLGYGKAGFQCVCVCLYACAHARSGSFIPSVQVNFSSSGQDLQVC